VCTHGPWGAALRRTAQVRCVSGVYCEKRLHRYEMRKLANCGVSSLEGVWLHQPDLRYLECSPQSGRAAWEADVERIKQLLTEGSQAAQLDPHGNTVCAGSVVQHEWMDVLHRAMACIHACMHVVYLVSETAPHPPAHTTGAPHRVPIARLTLAAGDARCCHAW
jgi:hypothetical protein